jgi:phosphatidylglycerophosphate synthase
MNQSLIKRTAWQAAGIAISSRIVGSAFRCLETLNPDFQQSKVISDPKAVCIRELSTLGMAFVFSLIANVIISPRAEARGWSKFAIQFLTTVIGTTIAETIGRMIAYKKALPKSPTSATTTPHPLPVSANPVSPSRSSVPVALPQNSYTSPALRSPVFR